MLSAVKVEQLDRQRQSIGCVALGRISDVPQKIPVLERVQGMALLRRCRRS